MTTLTEKQLITLIKEIEPKVIKSLNKYALNQQMNLDFVKDALQDAKIRAFKHINTYETDKPFHHWFLRIALNCMYDISKKNSKIPAYSLDQVYETTGDRHFPTANNIYNEIFGSEMSDEFNIAQSILNKLPPNLREPLYKKEFLDMSYEEMSKEMNIQIPALRVSVCRAKKRAREIAQKLQKV